MPGMKPYSEDLCRMIVAAVEGGMPKSEAAHLSDVILSSVKRYSRLAAREETHAPARRAAADPRRRTLSSRACSKKTSAGAPTRSATATRSCP